MQSLPARPCFLENRHNFKSHLCINMRCAEMLGAVKMVAILYVLRSRLSQEITGTDVELYPKCHYECRLLRLANKQQGEICRG